MIKQLEIKTLKYGKCLEIQSPSKSLDEWEPSLTKKESF